MDGDHVKINKCNLLYIKAEGDFSRLVLHDKEYMILLPIGKCEKQFGENFLRVHRSYIVNTVNVNRVSKHEIQCDDKAIPIGKSYTDVYAKILKSLPLV